MDVWILYSQVKGEEQKLVNVFVYQPRLIDLEHFVCARLFPSELERAFIFPGIGRNNTRYWLKFARMEFQNHLINITI